MAFRIDRLVPSVRGLQPLIITLVAANSLPEDIGGRAHGLSVVLNTSWA